MLRFLSGYALPILATALVMTATAAGVQTWRIGSLQEANGALVAEIDECANANEANQVTIKALVTAAKANAAQYENALDEARQAALRAQELETKLAERAADDIQTIQATDDACGHSRLPDPVRLRLAPSGDRDGRGPGNTGTAGPG